MGKRGSVLAWVVAFLAVAGMAASLVWAYLEHDRALNLAARVQQAETQTQQVQMQAQQQQESVARLQEKLSQLEQGIQGAQGGSAQGAGPAGTALDGAATPSADAGAGTPADAAQGAADGATAGAQNAAADADKPAAPGLEAFSNMFEGEQGEKMARMSADAAVNMHYQDLLTSLNLAPEDSEKVRQILVDNMARQIIESAKFMKSGGGQDMKQLEQDLREAQRNDLAQVLSAEELAVYDEYQAGFGERAIRKSFEMQMGMFMPNVNDESRQMVLDVMVEEFLALDQQGAGMMNQEDASAAMAALDRARDRVSTVLEEADMRQVDNFINQQRMGIEMFMQMTGAQIKPQEKK